MASLLPTRPTLHEEVEEEFSNIQLEMVHCSLCGFMFSSGLCPGCEHQAWPDELSGDENDT